MPAQPEQLAVFLDHGTERLYHYTTIENLLGIVEREAIYSRAELVARGIPYSSDHYYGDDSKTAALTDYVSCATLPPWGMMSTERDPLVILGLDVAAGAAPGCCYCPGWAAKSEYAVEEIVRWTGPEHVEAMYPTSNFQTKSGAEVFVPQAIPLAYARTLYFYDRETVEATHARLNADVARRGQVVEGEIRSIVDPSKFPRHWGTDGVPWED